MAAKRSSPKKKAKTPATKARPAKKRVTKKSAVKRPAGKKAPAKRATAKKATAKKAPAKKATAKKPATTSPKVAEIQQIIDVMVAAGAVELETDDGRGGRLRVRLKEDYAPGVAHTVVAPHAAPGMVSPAVHMPTHVAAPVIDASAPARPDNEEEFVSPMVGTFYRAASPEAEPFVNNGDSFGEDSTLCIIEAMKVMNEIKAELHGTITEILVENGEPVEFGQPLFRIVRN